VTVVADVNADGRVSRPEDRIPEIARLEEVLLPEAGCVRNVVLAILAEIRAIVVVDGGGVVVHAGLFTLVHRDDHRHPVFLRVLRHPFGRRPRHRLSDVVPMRVLGGTEIRAIEHFLQPEDLHAALPRFVDERNVRVDRRVANLVDRRRRIGDGRGGLDQTAENFTWH
jgi:hypothetical protein